MSGPLVPLDPRLLARSGDPPTSRAAAGHVQPYSHYQKIVLALAPGEQMIARAICLRAGFQDAHGTQRRCSDLRLHYGLLACVGLAESPYSGEEVMLLALTEAGIEYRDYLLGGGRDKPKRRKRDPAAMLALPPPRLQEASDMFTFTDGGFLPPGSAVVDQPPPKSVARRPRELTGQRGCEGCSLQQTWPQLRHPKMPVSGRADADILVIGEAPGETEDENGKPFVGDAGKVLRKVLPYRHADRLAMTNILRCHPAKNTTPTPVQMRACSLHLENDIAKRGFKAILGLGGAPLSQFLTGAGITQVHGLKFPVEIAGKVLWYYPALHPSYVLRTSQNDRSGGDSFAMPILENDLKRFFKEVDDWPDPVIEKPDPASVIQAMTEDVARGWVARLRHEGKPVGLDIETNGLRPNAIGAEIMSAAVSNGVHSIAWPVRHPEAANNWGLRLLLEVAETMRWIAHHAGFELAWLYEHARRIGGWSEWEPQTGFDDSMAAARLYQRRESCLNLGLLTRIYCGTNIKTLTTIDPERIQYAPLSEVLPYNGLDAWGSHRIFSPLQAKIDRKAYQNILDTIASVTEMQLVGLDTDQDAALALRDEWRQRAEDAVQHARTVYEVKRYENERQSEFNIGSAEQVGDALYSFGRVPLPRNQREETYKTDDATLTSLCPDNPLAKDTLAYRHAKKMDATYIEPVLQAPTRFVDGKLHPVYSTMLTRTFRTSCEDLNAQNFPKRKDRELRRQVVPPKGCLWVAADEGQLEARVYGMASQDKALCRSIIDKEDIHTYWLSQILDYYPRYLDRLASKVDHHNDDEKLIRKGGRDIIKSDFVFSSFYGTTARNVADRTGLPFDIAMDMLGAFWGRYPGAASWLKAQRRIYREYGVTRDLFGRERYGLMSGNEPINTPIQGTAARLVLDAQNELYRLARQHRDPHLLPRINIHDDLVFALPADDDDTLMVYVEEISKVMTRVRYPWQIVPLMVEWRIGENWADLYPFHEYTGDYV